MKKQGKIRPAPYSHTDGIEEEKAQILSSMDFEKTIEFGGRRYDIILQSTGVLDFIYEDLPMYNYVYEILEDKSRKPLSGQFNA